MGLAYNQIGLERSFERVNDLRFISLLLGFVSRAKCHKKCPSKRVSGIELGDGKEPNRREKSTATKTSTKRIERFGPCTTDYPDTSGEPATLQNTLTVTNLTATAEAIDWSSKYLETDQ